MVSRTPKPMMTRRSASDLKNRRPKRNISPKNLDDSVSGLSWKEERELKKALYASLQEARRQSREDKPEDEDSIADSRDGVSHSQSRTSLSSLNVSKFMDESSCSVDSSQSFTEKKETNLLETKKTKYHAQRKFAVNSFTPICPEPSSSGSRSTRCPSATHLAVKNARKKIHAQRKFAQGSTPSTPLEMPSKPKLKVSPVKLFPGRPKTEDFLTYLCFRGTSVLPPHLDLMSVKKEETESEITGTNGRSTRESSPASSSSISHQNEDSMDVPETPMRVQTPSRKAARASASTPETARGFANLRRGARNQNVSASKLSPGSRKRLADSYGPVGKLKCKSPVKGHIGDRLALKKKAMATLTAARRASPKKQEEIKKLRATVSEGDLQKRKRKLNLTSVSGKKEIENGSKSNGTRKRKSDGNLHNVNMPSPKRNKLQSSLRVKQVLKCRSKESRGHLKSKHRYFDSLETHPKKRLATTLRVRKTFKPHKPVTRATSHLKQALKAAKMAASKKLKLVSKSLPSAKSRKLTSLVRDEQRNTGTDKKKLSLESSGSKSSLVSFGSDNSGEIRIKTERFPGDTDSAAVVQCPTYYPSEEQFRDPILYIQSIQYEAEQYGMCKIVPPCSWKMESRELEDFRFTTQIQYIHKMLHKWSPITEQLEYVKRLHNDAGNDKFQVPQIGGVELDLVKLYELVQKYGGMKGTVGKEKKWLKIADAMKVPKQADRVSKLYAAYCKYLLAYETLSDEETEKLQDTVQADRHKHEAEKHLPPCYKCVYKGKSQPLSAFHRAARNTQQLYDPESCNDPEAIEHDYWEIVEKADDHLSVKGASLDTSIYGSMFPVRRDNVYARHGWNLHNFVESKGSILHHLGLIAGVTVPTLHISMLYTTKCLCCNEHNLPTVQYLHQGPGLVWYAVPSQETDNLKKALKKVAPKLVRNEGFCLPKESLMVPPSTLIENGVSLSRCVQTEREFVVIFPSVNYSNISLGYNMSESVHYGTQDWIPEGYLASKNLGINHDIELFSMDAMLVFLARDSSTQDTTLALLLPYLEKVVEREILERKKLFDAGLKETERLHDKLEKPSPKCDVLEEIIICDVSNKICYLSMVLNSHENSAFSLEQGLFHIQKRKNLKHCKLMYRYSEEELKALVKEVKSRLRGGNSTSPVTSSPKRKTRKSTSDLKTSPTSSMSSR